MTTIDLEQQTADERLAELLDRRARLSVDALDGDPSASIQLALLERDIAEVEHRAELSELARAERARLAARDAADVDRQAREQAEADAASAQARRDAALRDVQVTLAQLTENVQAFTKADAVYRDATVAASRRFRAVPLAELVVIAALDGGLKADGEPLAYIRASVRNSLRAQYPPPAPATLTLGPVRIGQCSICMHDHRGMIEGALRNGSSYRELEASFGVSKAAISRHVAHARSG